MQPRIKELLLSIGFKPIVLSEANQGLIGHFKQYGVGKRLVSVTIPAWHRNGIACLPLRGRLLSRQTTKSRRAEDPQNRSAPLIRFSFCRCRSKRKNPDATFFFFGNRPRQASPHTTPAVR